LLNSPSVTIYEVEDHQKIVQDPIKDADPYGRQVLEKARNVSVLDKFAIESAIDDLWVLIQIREENCHWSRSFTRLNNPGNKIEADF